MPTSGEFLSYFIVLITFGGAIWYLAKICTGACREARDEVRKLNRELRQHLDEARELDKLRNREIY